MSPSPHAPWRRAGVLLACVSLLHAAAASAQAPPAMTLTDALAYAAGHQPQIRQAMAEVAARQAEARVPRAAWLPRASAQAQLLIGTANNTTTSFVNARGVDVPRVSSTPVTASSNWSPLPSSIAALNVQQQLYDFGRTAAQAALADAWTDMARARLSAARLDIALRVEETFNAVLAARHILAASVEARRRAETHLRLAEAGVRSGMRPPIDRTRAQTELALADVQQTRAETGLIATRAALAAVIGSPELEIDALELAPGDRPFPTLDEALRIAQDHSPEVLAALGRVRIDSAGTSAATRELLPNLYFSGTLWGNAGGATVGSSEPPVGGGWLPSVGNYGLALVLEWRLLDPVALARRGAAQARERVAQAGLELARREAILQVQRTYLDLLAAQKTLPGLVATVAASRANTEQAEARFRAGLGSIVELTDAEALLVSSQLEQAVGQFNVARAAARLAAALGTEKP